MIFSVHAWRSWLMADSNASAVLNISNISMHHCMWKVFSLPIELQIRHRLYHHVTLVGDESQFQGGNRLYQRCFPANHFASKYSCGLRVNGSHTNVFHFQAHHHTMLEFNLPTNDVSLSTIFQVLQQAQNILSLQDYSVSQTTLDQVRGEKNSKVFSPILIFFP